MACIRYLTVLLVMIVGSGSIPSVAHAQDTCNTTAASGNCADEGKAAQAAYAAAAAYTAIPANNRTTCPPIQGKTGTTWSVRINVTPAHAPNCTGGGTSTPSYIRYYPPANSCAARLDGDTGMINGTLYSGGVCDDGCKVNPNLDPSSNFSMKEQGNPNIISIRSGTWKANGGVCTPQEDKKPEKKDEFCHTTSSGHTVCKSKDKTCVSTPSGFRTCASDTGNTKGHIETNKGRTEATSISAPDTPPSPPANRPGEDWQQTGNSTNITNNTKNTGNTTNNYYNNGKPNGNDTVPGDGSGPGAGGSNGNGDKGEGGEGQGNSATGGGDCKTPPVVTGDAALGMVATQAWATRCAVEAGASAKVSGDIGDCASPFTVEGDTPEAHQLRAMRAERCSAPAWAKAGAGDGNTGNPHDGAEGVDGPGNSTWTFDVDVLDTSGFGGGSCPQLGTLDFGRFGAVAMDGATWWCPLIAGLRAVMLLMGVFISFRILFGE